MVIEICPESYVGHDEFPHGYIGPCNEPVIVTDPVPAVCAREALAKIEINMRQQTVSSTRMKKQPPNELRPGYRRLVPRGSSDINF